MQGLESLRKKCPYSELFWPPFSRIQTDYGEILSLSSSLSPYSIQMRENVDQNNFAVNKLDEGSIIIDARP